MGRMEDSLRGTPVTRRLVSLTLKQLELRCTSNTVDFLLKTELSNGANSTFYTYSKTGGCHGYCKRL